MDYFLSVFNLRFILILFSGSFIGLVIGALPGLSVTMATALLLSVTYSWSFYDAIALMIGVYVVGVYSGAISSILVNIPGTPASVATSFDGFPMSRNGSSKKALWIATVYSFIGTVFGLIVLSLIAKPLSKIALSFSPVDYFLLALFGLTTVGSLTSKNILKGHISALLGVMLSMVGIDSIMGVPRFTFGSMNLQLGIPVVPVLIGLFGFSEVLEQISSQTNSQISLFNNNERVSIKEILKCWRISLISSAIGTVIGILPGAGAPVASLLAYDSAKKYTKNPEIPFGQGAPEGIAASESANNACIGGALVPMLTLGIPGDAVTAVMLSAFYVHGLRPGPLFIKENPQAFELIVLSTLIGSFFIIILGFLFIPVLSKVVLVPKKIMLPLIAILCIVGAYSVNSSLYEVSIMAIFGIIGFFMRKTGFSTAAMVLGLVLGEMMDSNFRRALSLSGSVRELITGTFLKPISIVIIVFIAFSIFLSIKSKTNAVKK
ncbi:MAG: tripartite tricarboxylate transporter permease [Petrotogaceae bacterium]|jgi:putative tricarboxylic transport membrane protein|nr:tripartite tricarboxylate transporter permease [Petrotogaceae bacterium]